MPSLPGGLAGPGTGQQLLQAIAGLLGNRPARRFLTVDLFAHGHLFRNTINLRDGCGGARPLQSGRQAAAGTSTIARQSG